VLHWTSPLRNTNLVRAGSASLHRPSRLYRPSTDPSHLCRLLLPTSWCVYAGARANLRLIFLHVVASRAPRKVLGSSTSASNSASLSSRKVENKYAGGNPVCVRPTPKWQKGIGEFFGLSPKDSDKENRIPEEAGSSGLGKAKRKARPLPPDHTDDEKE
uniref:PCNA-associated factor n=1 Tax=Felis catus TaxID=9685 RepID=A0ABI7ZN87_FELCA